jgi:hypothetical protein
MPVQNEFPYSPEHALGDDPFAIVEIGMDAAGLPVRFPISDRRHGSTRFESYLDLWHRTIYR